MDKINKLIDLIEKTKNPKLIKKLILLVQKEQPNVPFNKSFPIWLKYSNIKTNYIGDMPKTPLYAYITTLYMNNVVKGKITTNDLLSTLEDDDMLLGSDKFLLKQEILKANFGSYTVNKENS